MNNFLINVCIPFYNSSTWIEEALISIKQQVYKNYKIYIFNDGSTYEETQALKRIIRKLNIDPIVYNHKHSGLLYARYYMFKNIKQGIIMSLDADDYFVGENVFGRIVNEFKSSKCDVACFNIIKGNSKKPFCDFKNEKNKKFPFKYFLTNNNFNSVCSKAFVHNLIDIEALRNLTHIKMAEDRVASFLILKNSKRIKILDEIMYFYRKTPKSIVNSRFKLSSAKDQIEVEGYISDFCRQERLSFYSYKKYVNEFIIYTDIMLIYRNCRKFSYIKKDWQKLFLFIQKIDHLFSIEESIKLHKKITLKLFYSNRWSLLWIFVLCISMLKKIKHLIYE